MVNEDFAAVRAGQTQRLSPTDLSQFIRLGQCERYLRLRLHERNVNGRFMANYGVRTAPITPLLTRSGAAFEQQVMGDIAAHYATTLFASDKSASKDRDADNAALVASAYVLQPEETHVFFQARLSATLGNWQVRGDVDILRLTRATDGALHVLIADMKSSTTAKVEHRLQVAFYAEMLDVLFAAHAIAHAPITLAVLYRGSAAVDDTPAAAGERAAAASEFGTTHGLLESVADADAYRRSVRDLVTGPDSTAARVAITAFDDLAFHLDAKCDGCVYNEFCMKRVAARDDLSLVPHLTAQEKGLLARAGVRTVHELATLKEFAGETQDDTGERARVLAPAMGRETQCQSLATTRPVGARLDELIHRARRYRKSQGDTLDTLSYIPHKGYGSLPYADAAHNPNLIRVYLDAGWDYLTDRLYLVGALIVGCEAGEEPAARRQIVVEVATAVPNAAGEEALLLRWTARVLAGIAAVAAPDDTGAMKAPIHLIFYDAATQKVILEGLARHFKTIFAATPLYDLVTDLAAFDSPVVSYLSEEIRTQKNFPLLCQSLGSVAAWLGFHWDTDDTPFRQRFRTGLFDSQGRPDWDDATQEYYTRRARFGSAMPLEYAYAAWGELTPPERGKRDDSAPYREITLPLLTAFAGRRLEAMEHVARDFTGNKYTEKTAFDLTALATFAHKADSLAAAMDEFVTLERHVELGQWKAARYAPPERRVLAGETLIVRYDAAENPEREGAREENARRAALKEEIRAAFLVAHPGRVNARYTAEQKTLFDPLPVPPTVRFVLDSAGVGCNLAEILALTAVRQDDWLVLCPRLHVDTRPDADPTPRTPTAKQLLHGQRVILKVLDASGRSDGRVIVALELIEHSGTGRAGYVFSGFAQELTDGARYTLDPNPNNATAAHSSEVSAQLVEREAGLRTAHHTLYDALTGAHTAVVTWPETAAAAQDRFLWGITRRYPFEEQKLAFIGEHGDTPILLVQGPPGMGKSFSTAYALFARLQGAMAAGRSYRVFVSCHSHAAIDVVMAKLRDVQAELAAWHEAEPEVFTTHFDARLLAMPLFRVDGRGEAISGVEAIARTELDRITNTPWCIVGATPGAIYNLVKARWGKDDLLGHEFCDCLVLDEASQMNLPEAMMTALPLAHDGQLIVVGDHRQMPPIIKHDWESEPRRTFSDYRAYDSLFQLLYTMALPTIKFAESFRLHADMAAFLCEEIYRHDDIPFFSSQHAALPAHTSGDPLVNAMLMPAYPLVVVVHDEAESQFRNTFEASLIAPLVAALAAPPYALEPTEGIGIVVPHRAQRALLRDTIPGTQVLDAVTGVVIASSVDTVERFQGSERTVIVVSATESDRMYLLASSAFLFDPRRLTVALSRAKQKVIVVASRSVFTLFSADEETFAHTQLWKNLLGRTCTVPLWEGERAGTRVQVWGNAPRA